MSWKLRKQKQLFLKTVWRTNEKLRETKFCLSRISKQLSTKAKPTMCENHQNCERAKRVTFICILFFHCFLLLFGQYQLLFNQYQENCFWVFSVQIYSYLCNKMRKTHEQFSSYWLKSNRYCLESNTNHRKTKFLQT